MSLLIQLLLQLLRRRLCNNWRWRISKHGPKQRRCQRGQAFGQTKLVDGQVFAGNSCRRRDAGKESVSRNDGSHAAHPFTCKQRRWQMQAKALKKLQLELPGYTQKFCWSNWRGKRCELQHERVRRVREAEGNHRKPSIEKLREAGISL